MAQMTTPESIVRAIMAAPPGAARTQVLAALGIRAADGGRVDDQERADALSELIVGTLTPEDRATQEEVAASTDLGLPAGAAYDDEELPF